MMRVMTRSLHPNDTRKLVGYSCVCVHSTISTSDRNIATLIVS